MTSPTVSWTSTHAERTSVGHELPLILDASLMSCFREFSVKQAVIPHSTLSTLRLASTTIRLSIDSLATVEEAFPTTRTVLVRIVEAFLKTQTFLKDQLVAAAFHRAEWAWIQEAIGLKIKIVSVWIPEVIGPNNKIRILSEWILEATGHNKIQIVSVKVPALLAKVPIILDKILNSDLAELSHPTTEGLLIIVATLFRRPWLWLLPRFSPLLWLFKFQFN